MNTTEIKNFAGNQALTIHQGGGHDKVPPIVTITQWSGSMSFQFSMTPEQAMDLADALTEHASAARRRADARAVAA